jgi:hypothetical protein
MNRTKLSVLGLSLALGVGGTLLLYQLRAPEVDAGPPAPAEPGGQIQAFADQLAALRRDLDSLPRSQPDQTVGAEAKDAPPVPPNERAQRSEAERRQAAEESHLKAVKQLEGHLEREGRDPTWTSQLQDEVAMVLPAASGSTVESVDCRTNLCRVELAHQDKLARDRFTNEQSNSLHYEMDILLSPSGQGFRSTIFLARRGHKMPDWGRELANAQKLAGHQR